MPAGFSGHYGEAFLVGQFVDRKILSIKSNNVLHAGIRCKTDYSCIGKIHWQVCVFLHQIFCLLQTPGVDRHKMKIWGRATLTDCKY